MVCTAAPESRLDCDGRCDRCRHLRADRRLAATAASLERRLFSNVLPPSLDAAAAAMSLRSFSRQYATAFMGLLMVFNLLDVVLTMRALSMGVAEANPVMAGLFQVSLPVGMAAKFAAVSLGAVLLWHYRHLPLASRGMNILAGLYGAVVVYHLAFQLGTL